MNRKINVIQSLLCGCAMTLALPLCADSYTDGSLANITNTTRFVKSGSGTLVLSGDNSLTTLTMEAGTLKISGGTTTLTTSTGGTNSNAPYEQKGGTIVVEGGAEFNISAPNHMVNWGGDLLVTNGVFDASPNEFLNGYYVSTTAGKGRMIIQDDGVVKVNTLRVTQTGTSSLTDNVGLFLNDGGKLYVTSLFVDGSGRYGVIRYNGGTIYKMITDDITRLYTGTDAAWDTVKSYVHEGGFRIVNNTGRTIYLNRPLYSGVDNDGGVHYVHSNGGYFWLQDEAFGNSTFKGGTWLEDNSTLVDYLYEAGLGAVPESPRNNVFFMGTNTFFGGGSTWTMHRNRNVFIGNGANATLASNSSVGMRIGGEISVFAGEGFSTNTIVCAGNSTWTGRIILDPGEGRTNRLDRLQAVSRLEIASGVTLVRSTSKGIEADGPIYIFGDNSAYANDRGRLFITGGRLEVEGNRWVTANRYAQVVVSGGTFSAMTNYAEYLNGLNGSPATLTIENGGLFEFYRTRISQSSTKLSEINVNTGGVLRTAYFYMDNDATGALNLNGGTIVAYVSSTVGEGESNKYLNMFLGDGGDGAGKWANVTVRVLAGGAKFNTDGYSPKINVPLLSGVGEGETDGGLTKSGSGTLTMTKTSTYNGPTRLDGGTLKFADTSDASGRGGRPDTDIEFTAEALMDCAEHPFIEAPSLGMGAGKVIRVTECDALDAAAWQGSWHTVATFDNVIPALPSVTFVKSDGTVGSTENGWSGWAFRIGADGKSLQFKRARGTTLVVR